MVAAATIYEFERLGLVFAGLLVLIIFLSKSTVIAGKCLKWTLPFAVPLIAIHGVLNPAFSAIWVWDAVPVRQDGIAYGLLVSGRIGLLTLAVTCWAPISRETILESIIRIRSIPLAVAMVMLQALSMLGIIKRRMDMIQVAQRSRGVPFGPSVYARIKAMPAMVIPVIVTTITDADARAIALMTRGLGSGPVVGRQEATPVTPAEWFLMLSAAAVVVFAATIF